MGMQIGNRDEEIDKPRTLEDVERAKDAVRSAIPKIKELPPRLGVEMTNILRCLELADFMLRYSKDADE